MFQDYARSGRRCGESGAGVIAIRVLAGGALAALQTRHPTGASRVDPIATGRTYAEDVQARTVCVSWWTTVTWRTLWKPRFASACLLGGVSTALVGISSYEQLDAALAYTQRGPLGAEALAMIQPVVRWRFINTKLP